MNQNDPAMNPQLKAHMAEMLKVMAIQDPSERQQAMAALLERIKASKAQNS